MTIQVAVIDDHDVVRKGVQHTLSEIPQSAFVGGFATVAAFCESAASRKADVVLLDDSLPDMDELQALQVIQAHCPETAVLLLGSRLTSLSVHQAIRAGAAGVICKQEQVQDILAMGIRYAHAGTVYLSPHAGLIAAQAGQVPALSQRLYSVLKLMARGHRVADIMRTLVISRRAVYRRRERLRDILDVETNEQIVAEAIRRGLLSPEDLPENGRSRL